ncbi:unnamed protein product [Hermetia illucens]|uniref:RING-type E3 ubiquitin transferase n=1 Tax=Hermetia illucens TaxID=343691 RepID=A0A7R8V370_HERIL|nr:probable E3 ubiquitin-protein ligase MGRN1 isoform X2 [Hermetia illucens]CAD7091813.1 unnamed protein product [Hermetia illucens]
MGALMSRQNAAIEEADVGSNHAYKYPPKSGNYFGTHFIMGGERFDTPQPEAYLFGENADLNFLGSRPTAFPYPPPQANEPTKTLKSLVNIRKESVRFVKTSETNLMNIEFIFDSDAKCAITIYYFCSEEVTPNGVILTPRDPSLNSETYRYKRGVTQSFSQPTHMFNPNLYSEEDLCYNPEKDCYPIAIHCVVDEGAEELRQSHTTICVVDHHADGTYALRALKQKIFVDGLCYLLQEIYGIENKAINKPTIDDDSDENGSECVICMSETRDTLILPCRHLCLCNSCADSLRYQANNCPICRAPFRALLQIRAVQKSLNTTITNAAAQNPSDPNCEHIPPGYTPVSLIEALNGPPAITGRSLSNDGSDTLDAVQAIEILNKSRDKNDKQSTPRGEKRSKDKNSTPAEFRMSVLLTKENEETPADTGSKQQNGVVRNDCEKASKEKLCHSRNHSRESVQIINERNNSKRTQLEGDEDSDNENLSPLLNSQTLKVSNSALHIDGVEESIDDTDTDADDTSEKASQRKRNRPALPADGDGVILAGAEDSDYYTPEDPQTTILSPLCPEKSKGSEKTISKENVTVKAPSTTTIASTALKENINSLPDSPISGNSSSTRSSGDSYSSSSSTKQLLSKSPPVNDANTKIVLDDKSNTVTA